MIHLRSIELRRPLPAEQRIFPFSVPAIGSLEKIHFETPVTFLVGENGSGKSTFLEALALASSAFAIGSHEVRRDETLKAVSTLAKKMRLTWERRTHRGFFLRAEDFFGFAKRLATMRSDLEADLRAVDEEYQGRSAQAVNLAKMPYQRELAEMEARYGLDLNARSHGESFLTLFQSRFVPDGLYLLDEPEAPLSPLRQVGLIALLKEMVARNGQFIIATHSPILMAYPGATILNFDEVPVRPTAYGDLDHVTVTRAFLNDPELYLQHL